MHGSPRRSEVWPISCFRSLQAWDRTPSLGALVNIPDAWLAENSPAMTSATLPSGYCRPPLHAYPHVPGKPRQHIVAQPACLPALI